MPHGHVVETTAEGDVYEGAFVNGQRSGDGKLSLKSGRIYEGDFVENAPNGQGKLIMPGELQYVGKFTPNGE